MASRKPSLIVVPQLPASCSPDPEVVPKASRRTFSAAEKLRILNEADACTQCGQIGALLRREGLYSSHLVKWRRLRAAGQLQALAPQPHGPKPTPPDPVAEELAQLRKENARLQARIAQAELIIDVEKKVAQLLGEPHPAPQPDEPSEAMRWSNWPRRLALPKLAGCWECRAQATTALDRRPNNQQRPARAQPHHQP